VVGGWGEVGILAGRINGTTAYGVWGNSVLGYNFEPCGIETVSANCVGSRNISLSHGTFVLDVVGDAFTGNFTDSAGLMHLWTGTRTSSSKPSTALCFFSNNTGQLQAGVYQTCNLAVCDESFSELITLDYCGSNQSGTFSMYAEGIYGGAAFSSRSEAFYISGIGAWSDFPALWIEDLIVSVGPSNFEYDPGVCGQLSETTYCKYLYPYVPETVTSFSPPSIGVGPAVIIATESKMVVTPNDGQLGSYNTHCNVPSSPTPSRPQSTSSASTTFYHVRVPLLLASIL
jgi:hypothetical protein